MPTYLRGTRVHVPPDKIDQSAKFFADNIVPAVRKTPGNLGAGMLVNRQTGDGIGLTYWDSAKSLGASEQVGIDSRIGATKNVPQMQVINVERSEIVLMERAGPPKVGTFLRYTSGTGDITKIDAAIAYVRDKVLPVQRAQKGFRSLIASVDRQTGRSHVASTWDTMADLEASEKHIAPLRQESAKVSGMIPETVKVEILEALVVEMAAAVTAATAGTRS